jgi:hypothetical protein
VVIARDKPAYHVSTFLACLVAILLFDMFFADKYLQAQSNDAGSSRKTLRAWFGGAEEARKYGIIQNEVELLALELRFSGLGDGLGERLSESLLVDRLVEGSKKKIPAEKLLGALKDETRRLQSIARLLNERGLFPVGRADGPTAEASLLFRAGLEEGDFSAALDDTAELEDFKDPLPKVQRIITALSTLMAINTRFHLDSGDRRRLTAALVLSEIPRERFGSLISLFARARASGLAQSRICSLVIEYASSGSTMERIERELERRMRTP